MADAVTAEAGAHGSGDAGGTKPFRVFLTEDEFNAHAAGIRAAAERKAKAVPPDERARLESLEAELALHKQRDLEAAGNYEQAKQSLEKAAADKIAKAEAAAAKLKGVLVRNVEAQVKALASAHGAYDPEDVVVRVMPRVAVDEDGTVHVSDAPGGTVQDGLSLETAIADLLASKPHLAATTGSGRGAGSRGGASVNGPMSGSQAVREAQAKVEAAKQRLAEHPRDNAASAAMLDAMMQLKLAQAK